MLLMDDFTEETTVFCVVYLFLFTALTVMVVTVAAAVSYTLATLAVSIKLRASTSFLFQPWQLGDSYLSNKMHLRQPQLHFIQVSTSLL